MTSVYINNWMLNHSHYRMQLAENRIDNPDQRISEDIDAFIGSTWMFTFQLLNNVIMLGSFLVILWNLSNSIPLILGGRDWSFPGYFIVIALLWAIFGTYVVHWFGRQLIRLNFNQTVMTSRLSFFFENALPGKQVSRLLFTGRKSGTSRL